MKADGRGATAARHGTGEETELKPDEQEKVEIQEKIGPFKKARAVICKHCPLCNAARNSPQSVVGRLLHHPMHSDNCPMWTAYQQVYENQENAGSE